MFSIKSPEKHVNCIYGVIRPLYLFGRFIGFFPFSVKIQMNGKNSKVYFSFIDFIVLVIHVAVYGSFAYINIQHNLLASQSTSPLLLVGTRALLILGILNGILCISADLWNRFKIFKIFDHFQMFDCQMQAIGSQLNHSHSRLVVNVYMVIWTVINVVFTVASLWIYQDIYEWNVLGFIFLSYFLVNSTFATVLSIYFFFLFSLESRFSLLNESFSRLLLETKSIKIVTTSKTDTIETIVSLANLHDLLNEILVMVNRCYSIQVMLAVGLCFSFAVFCLFSCYRGWIARSNDDYIQFKVAIVLVQWALFYYFFVIAVLWTGHSIKNKGKFTGTLLHRAINRCSNDEVIGRLLAFSQQLNHRIPDANCNLFSFDWTLFHSMVAATVTYLIILIQFDASGYYPGGRNVSNMSTEYTEEN